MVFHLQREEDRQDVYCSFQAHSHLVKTRYLANNFVNSKPHEQSRTTSTLLSVGFLFPRSSSKYRVFMSHGLSGLFRALHRFIAFFIHRCAEQSRTPSTLRPLWVFLSCYASKYRVFGRNLFKAFLDKRSHVA